MKIVRPVPEGYSSVTPYLIVNGAAKAIEFYRRALGASEIARCEMNDGQIAHAEIQIGNAKIMLADEYPQMGYRSPLTIGGTPVSFMVYVENVDQMVAQAVAAGMIVQEPISDKFYGERTGTLKDPFGHMWTIGSRIEDLTIEEIKRRMQEKFG